MESVYKEECEACKPDARGHITGQRTRKRNHFLYINPVQNRLIC